MSEALRQHNVELDNFIEVFQVRILLSHTRTLSSVKVKITSVTGTHHWMANFDEDQRNFRAEVLSSLSKLETKANLLVEVVAAREDEQYIDDAMDKMQCVSTAMITLFNMSSHVDLDAWSSRRR